MGEHIDFDKGGRCLVYDALPSNLQYSLGPLWAGSAVASLVAFFHTPAVHTLSTTALLHWGGISYFSLVMLNQMRQVISQATTVTRIFLLQEGNIVRLLFADGKEKDVPLSSIKFEEFNGRTGSLFYTVDKKAFSANIPLARSVNIALLYVIGLDGVKAIQV